LAVHDGVYVVICDLAFGVAELDETSRWHVDVDCVAGEDAL
jgi:hypothetical protein